ncbi:MAG: glycosyltransferase family 2 protein [Flavobacteriales bacterium]|nr:glycosyltransferase family 2 protein [Flavobacteriales bacterium]
MAGISAVIITRDEAHDIGRCIASVQGVADEVVVVDSGSTDDTCAIARAAGARVVEHAWEGYAAQKNFANGLAVHDHILSLDADEALSPELARVILEVKRTGPHGAYRFARLTNYCGTWVRHGGWYPDVKLRLFPKGAARWEGEHVHEELRLDAGTEVHDLKGDLLHWSYRSVKEHLERIERYSDLHALKMNAEGRRATWTKRLFAPPFKFFQGYVLLLGFLDGLAGLRIAWYSAYAVAMKYTKLQRLGLART